MSELDFFFSSQKLTFVDANFRCWAPAVSSNTHLNWEVNRIVLRESTCSYSRDTTDDSNTVYFSLSLLLSAWPCLGSGVQVQQERFSGTQNRLELFKLAPMLYDICCCFFAGGTFCSYFRLQALEHRLKPWKCNLQLTLSLKNTLLAFLEWSLTWTAVSIIGTN